VVRVTARRWHLPTLYTRFTQATAIQRIEQDRFYASAYTILGAAAKLARDGAQRVGRYFAIYAQDTTGKKLVIVVTTLGGDPVQEGDFGDYGFGSTELQTSVPLNLSDWVRAVAKSGNWNPSNLP
jgi:hypothetical protein